MKIRVSPKYPVTDCRCDKNDFNKNADCQKFHGVKNSEKYYRDYYHTI